MVFCVVLGFSFRKIGLYCGVIGASAEGAELRGVARAGLMTERRGEYVAGCACGSPLAGFEFGGKRDSVGSSTGNFGSSIEWTTTPAVCVLSLTSSSFLYSQKPTMAIPNTVNTAGQASLR